MNRKRFWIGLVLLCCLLLPSGLVAADELTDLVHEAGYTEALESNRPKASIVIDAKTGDILWGDNIDEKRDPASMSKLLALYLVYEAMDEGKFSLDTVVTATDIDQAISELWEISNNKIVSGVDYTVEELIIATLVPSSNVATLMLANLVEPDPDAFIDLQNAKAKELGMENTTFNNATGAVARAFGGYYAPQRHDNYIPNETTVRDYAILTYNLVKRFPGILNYTKDSQITIKEGTPYEQTFHSYNHSLAGGAYAFEGMTGLKTGSSPSAGFNITGTAKRGDNERIIVMMGVGDWSDQQGEYYRHPFVNTLLEKSFKEYEYKELAKAGEQTISGEKVILENPVYGTVPVGKTAELTFKDNQVTVNNGLDNLSTAIKSEQVVAAKKAGLFSFGSSSNTEKSSKTKLQQSIFPLVGGIILIILCVLGIIVLLERERNKHAKKRRALKNVER